MNVLTVIAFVLFFGAGSPTLGHEQAGSPDEDEDVKWDTSVETVYCNDCIEVMLVSTGGVLEHASNRLGQYTLAASLWNNTVPVFKSENGQYLTPGPSSNPNVGYVKWVISENVGGMNAGIQNEEYTDGINCPWDIPDSWEYAWNWNWYVDPTFRANCIGYRGQK